MQGSRRANFIHCNNSKGMYRFIGFMNKLICFNINIQESSCYDRPTLCFLLTDFICAIVITTRGMPLNPTFRSFVQNDENQLDNFSTASADHTIYGIGLAT